MTDSKLNYYITENTTLYSEIDNIRILPVNSDTILEKIISSLETSTEIYFDTETDGLEYNSKCLLLQLGNTEYNVVFDVNGIKKNTKLFKRILDILSNPNITKVGINLKYDYKIIYSNFNIRLNNLFDCMLAELIINGGLKVKANAATLVYKYAGVTLDKTLGADFAKCKGITLSHIKYAIEDIAYLKTVKNHQLNQLQSLDLLNIFALENQALRVVSEIEMNGFKIDSKKWLIAYKDNLLELKEIEQQLDDEFLTFPEIAKMGIILSLFPEIESRKLQINYSSPLQLLSYLKKIGINVQDTDKKSLISFKSHTKYGKLITKCIQYSEKDKEISTYGKKFLEDYNIYPDNRIRTDFWQILDTGRLSSSKPNLQNIPRNNKFRNCFISEKSWTLVSTDYSQQELRILAALSQEDTWLEAFRNNIDLHTYMTIKTFKVPESDVKKVFPLNPTYTYRDIQKTINFGLAFGMTYYKLSNDIGITKEEAKAIIDDYFSNAPKLKAFLDYCTKYALENRRIRTAKPYRRLRLFDTKDLSFKEEISIGNQGKNTPIQGTAADMMKLALVNIFDYIEKNNLYDLVKPVMQVHDDIICEVHDSFVDEWAKIQMKILQDAAASIISPDVVVFKSDLNCMKTWTK